MIAKVTKVEKLFDPTDSFPMFTIAVGLDNGEDGLAYAKSANPPYGPGDMVEVTVNGQTKGGKNKFKVSKQKEGFGGSQSYQGTNNPSQAQQSSQQASSASPASSNGARVGAVFNKAVDIMIANTHEDRNLENGVKCINLAIAMMKHTEEAIDLPSPSDLKGDHNPEVELDEAPF